jgi:meso-butanediol dehydrogenase/(S,S)-butanediol dehydrogenase/diacetyl reductase
MGQLDGKVALITGAGQGVGQGIAYALAGEGARIAAAGWESGPLATFRLMKLCHPHLRGGGVIINLASTAAKRWDMAFYGAYAAVKEAIRSLTRAAASEWGAEGIRANAILPHAKSPGLEW